MNVITGGKVLDTIVPRSVDNRVLKASALASGNDVTTISIPAKSGVTFQEGQDLQFEISDSRRLANLQDAYIRGEFEIVYKNNAGELVTQSMLDEVTSGVRDVSTVQCSDFRGSLYGCGSTVFAEQYLDLITMRVENIRFYNHYSTSEMAIFNSARGNLARLIENFGSEVDDNEFGRDEVESLINTGRNKNTFIHYPNSPIMQMFSAYPTYLAPVTLTYRLENVSELFNRYRHVNSNAADEFKCEIVGYNINRPVLVVKMTTPKSAYAAKLEALLQNHHLEYPLKLVQTHVSNGLGSSELKVALSVGVNKSVSDMRTVFIRAREQYQKATKYKQVLDPTRNGEYKENTDYNADTDGPKLQTRERFAWSHEGLREWSISPDISTTIPQGLPFTRWDALAQLIAAFDPLEPKLTTGSDKFLGTWRKNTTIRNTDDKIITLDSKPSADIERSTIFSLFYSFKQSNASSSSEIFGDGLSTQTGIIHLNLSFSSSNPLPTSTRVVTWVSVERILRLSRNSVSTVAWWETA